MKARSKASSWSPEKVVLDLRCFLFSVIPGSDSVSESSQDDGPDGYKNTSLVQGGKCGAKIRLKLISSRD